MPPRPRMQYMQAYLTLRDIVGRPLPPEQLIQRIQRYGWEPSFFVLAQLAAALANRGGPNSEFVKDLTLRQLRHLSISKLPVEVSVAKFVTSNDHRIIAHDQAVQFLQALVLLYGADNARQPAPLEVAIWLLGASDHLHAWLVDDEDPAALVEDVFVNLDPVVETPRQRRQLRL